MENELDDWELALLVESRKHDDPRVVEAAAEEAYRTHKGLIEAAGDLDDPVVVEREVAQEHDRASDLLDAAEGVDDPVVSERDTHEANQEAVDAVEEALSGAIVENHDLKEDVVDGMSAPQMVDQFRDEDDDSDGGLSLEALAQHPETGGDPDGGDGAGGGSGDGGSGGFDPSAVDADDRQDARDKLNRADRMADRTPDLAEEYRQEAASLLGLEGTDELGDVDVEVL